MNTVHLTILVVLGMKLAAPPSTVPAMSEEQEISTALSRALYPESREDALGAEADLLEKARERKGELIIREFFKLVVANHDEDRALTLGRLYGKLELRGDEILNAVSPYLHDPDPFVARCAEMSVSWYYRPRPHGIDDLDVTQFLQRGRDKAAAEKIVELLLQVEPDGAVIPIAKAYLNPEKRKDVIWTAHTISGKLWEWNNGFGNPQERVEAIEQLKKLSTRSEWWVRYYVASMLRQHGGFRDPDLLDRLRKDEDGRVRTLAAQPYE